jgi:hypothetical protein
MLFAVLFYTMDMQQLQMTGYERTFIFSFLTWHWLKFSFNTQKMELTFQALKYHEFWILIPPCTWANCLFEFNQ